MLDSAGNLTICPEQIVVVGGGRWARVLTGVLCGFVAPSVKIFLHTSHNVDSMSSWITSQNFEQDIVVSSNWPDVSPELTAAMIVVNAARDHEKTIERALKARIPILVEKPVTFSEKATKRLVNLANKNNVPFFSAHVFLFASYLKNFFLVIPKIEKVQCLRIFWVDPQIESRYGEQKQYDSGLPIHADSLPHIVSIASMFTSHLSTACKSLKYKRGGAHLNVELMLGDIPCYIELIRNGDKRSRLVEVTTDKEDYKLDFTNEPGTITYSETELIGDSDWSESQRPAAQMLMAFLTCATGGELDKRLSIDVGLSANSAIDQVSILYNLSLNKFLVDKFSLPLVVDDNLRYALKEILSSEGPLSEHIFNKHIKQIQLYCIQSKTSDWFEKLNDISSVSEVVRYISQEQ
jgi:predicted dehydrogenase